MNQLTRLAIQGYLEGNAGAHPSTVIAIPFTLAEWKAILKDSPSEAVERDAERYRWLREQFCPPLTATHPVVIGGWGLAQTAAGGFVPTQRKLYEDAEQVDAAIDIAMQSSRSDRSE